MSSRELVTRMRQDYSVLVVPGDHFGMDGYLRLGFGEDADYLSAALERVRACIADLGMGIADSLRSADLASADLERADLESADLAKAEAGIGSSESTINPQSGLREPQAALSLSKGAF